MAGILHYPTNEAEVVAETYYQCPTCDLYVSDTRPVTISYEDESESSYEYPVGKVHKWYFLTHYYADEEGYFPVPVFSDDIFSYKLGCLYETFWEAEAAKGVPITQGEI